VTMFDLWRKIRQIGRVAEPAPPRPPGVSCPKAAVLHGSVQVRHVDAGSCNGCEIETGSAFGPVYDAKVQVPPPSPGRVVTGPRGRAAGADKPTSPPA
jgi:hypothetical protein